MKSTIAYQNAIIHILKKKAHDYQYRAARLLPGGGGLEPDQQEIGQGTAYSQVAEELRELIRDLVGSQISREAESE